MENETRSSLSNDPKENHGSVHLRPIFSIPDDDYVALEVINPNNCSATGSNCAHSTVQVGTVAHLLSQAAKSIAGPLEALPVRSYGRK